MVTGSVSLLDQASAGNGRWPWLYGKAENALLQAGPPGGGAPSGFIRVQGGTFVDDDCNEFLLFGWNRCRSSHHCPALWHLQTISSDQIRPDQIMLHLFQPTRLIR